MLAPPSEVFTCDGFFSFSRWPENGHLTDLLAIVINHRDLSGRGIGSFGADALGDKR